MTDVIIQLRQSPAKGPRGSDTSYHKCFSQSVVLNERSIGLYRLRLGSR